MAEEWRPVVGWPAFAVSSLGRVRREGKARGARVGHLLRPRPAIRGGYLTVTLCMGGRAKTLAVHVLVAEAFLGPRPAGRQVDHIDGDPTNPRADNLRWKTPLENVRESIAAGRQAVGQMMPQSKLTPQAVREIRALAGLVTQAALAERYGVAPSLISGVQTGRKWAHVEPIERERAS